MSNSKIRISMAGIATVTMLLAALPAAALSVNASAAATVSASSTSVSVTADARLQNIITQGNADIAARINALNALNARVQGLEKVSADQKVKIATEVQANITGLNSLKAKIDADTDATTAKTDAATIFTAFRIYALVIPQGWILSSADRVTVIDGLMTSLSANIQTRINADQAAGKNVSALVTTLADMKAKVADSGTQSASAEAGVTALVPDQGDKTVAASNRAALVAARADIKAATNDLQAARKDITTLLAGLKALDGSASASASVKTQ